MQIHPLFNDPIAVLILRNPPDGAVTWDNFHQAARRALKALQIELEGEKVIIKPNVTSGERFANPEMGISTHPAFVQGLVEYFQELRRIHPHTQSTIPVTIAEDPRDSDDNHPRHWRGTGYERVAALTGARLHTPTTYTCVKKTVPRPQIFQQLNVSRLATAPNTMLINVPKLKTHNLAITSLCMKNLMGLVNVFDRHYCGQAWRDLPADLQAETRPRTEWFTPEMHTLWQSGLARRLVDTAQVLQPALNIIEGVVGREGTGFQRGRNFSCGLVIAGVNMVAVDSVASYMMGFDPQELVYVRLAAEAGLGENRLSALQVYTTQTDPVTNNEHIVPVSDLSALRCNPPFKVICNVTGETESEIL